jgi:hypothetical protein
MASLSMLLLIVSQKRDGCEIWHAACGQSGVILWLKLVKGTDLPGACPTHNVVKQVGSRGNISNKEKSNK